MRARCLLGLLVLGLFSFPCHASSFRFNRLSFPSPDQRFGVYEPLSLSAADFDEDGVPDLAVGYRSVHGGGIVIYRGNIDPIYPNTPEAKQRRKNGTDTESPFLFPGRRFSVKDPPDFLAAGDFDADGHFDVLTAARNQSALTLYSGDGKGSFASARTLRLDHPIMALVSGDVDRRDGLADLVAATESAELLIFRGPRGAFDADPERITLPAPARSLLIAELNDDAWIDIAAAAGADLIIVDGKDGRRSRNISSIPIGQELRSLSVGDFLDTFRRQISALAVSGTTFFVDPKQGVVKQQPAPLGEHLLRVKSSAAPGDDLLFFGSAGLQFDNPLSRSSQRIPLNDSIVAVLPMRLNSDALQDLVVLRKSSPDAEFIITAPTAVFTVNSNDDADDSTCDGTHCSLREAINAANANAGADTIEFNIGTGAQTIEPATILPTITESVTIDGTTQDGFLGDPLIEISGVNIPGDIGLNLNGGTSTVRGLVINRFSGGFSSEGIRCASSIIEGNFIGTDLNGTAAAGNRFGIRHMGDCTIGGTVSAARNVLSGNNNSAIHNNSSMQVLGNYFGTDKTGEAIIANDTAIFTNTWFGITVTIGGLTPGSGNVISGNTRGIWFYNPGSTLIQGNLIGTDKDGMQDVGNTYGIYTQFNSEGTIGGSSPAARNIISGNTIGIYYAVSGAVSTGSIQGNYIGTAIDGVAPLGNSWHAILMEIPTSNIVIGGSASEANVIAFNGGDGIEITSGTANAIRLNRIHSNSGLGIDLLPNGITANDSDDPDTGPNNLQNFPILSVAGRTATETVVQGSLNSVASSDFDIDFYSNTACDGSGNGEGETYLGSTSVTTDSNGDVAFSVNLPVTVTLGEFITATATDSSNNTSEFSACVTVLPAISIDDVAVTEGDAGTVNADFTVTLHVSTPAVVTVDHSTADDSASAGSDYTAIGTTTLTFPADDNTPQTVTVQVSGDTDGEGDETFFVNLFNPTNAVIIDPQGVGTIQDDDPPEISIDNIIVGETESGTITADFMISLSYTIPDPITFDYSTSSGTAAADADYVSIPTTQFTIPGNTPSLPLTVTIIGDTEDEIDETFFVDLSNPSPNAAIADAQGEALVQDNDSTWTINNENDSGAGSLRQAILDAATASGGNTLVFNLAGAGIHTISPATSLPVLPPFTFIDGLSQPGATSGNLLIRIDGELNGLPIGLDLTNSPNNTIRGLILSGFENAGIFLSGGLCTANTIQNNLVIGSGTLAPGDGPTPMSTRSTTASPIVPGYWKTNLDEISEQFGGRMRTWIQDKHFDKESLPAARNVNALEEVPTGYGIRICCGSSNNQIGGINPGEGNTIAGNGGTGVIVVDTDSDQNSIRGNSIYDNGFLGIDLGENGVTPNDGSDSDSGPNQEMNFPTVTQATTNGASTTIAGHLSTPAPDTAIVDLYASNASDPSGYGEGETYLASVTPNMFGNFNAAAAAVPVGSWITAAATDANGNTSEFSGAFQVQGPTAPATNLTATAKSSSSIQLSWTDPQDNETGFRIERSPDATAWSAIDSVGPNTVTYLDMGLNAATLYYYRVVAYSIAGDAGPSNAASAVTFPITAASVCRQFLNPTHQLIGQGTAVAHNGTQWAMAWADRKNGDDWQIFFQLMNQGSGAPEGVPVSISNDDMAARFPTLKWNGSNFLLAWWEHLRNPDGSLKHHFAFSILEDDGTVVRGPIRVFSDANYGFINDSADTPIVWNGTEWVILRAESNDKPTDVALYRLNANGDLIAGPIQITNSAEWDYDLSIDWNGVDEYGISWLRYRDNHYEIYFQRLQSDGTPIGAPLQIWDNAANLPAYSTSMVWDGTDWVVVWTDTQSPDGNEVVMLAKVDASGNLVAGPNQISPDYVAGTGGHDEYPRIFLKPGGGYVIYVQSLLETPSKLDFEIGRLEADAAGMRTGTRTLVSPGDNVDSFFFFNAASDGTDFLVGWEETSFAAPEIANAIVSAAGVPGAMNQVSTGHTGAQISRSPAVAPLQGGFVTVWNESFSDGTTQIYSTLFDNAGAATQKFPLTATGVLPGRRPAVVGLGDSFAVAWISDAVDLIFRRFDDNGDPLTGEIQVATGTGLSPALDFNGEHYGVLYRQNGLKLQRVAPDGTLVGTAIDIPLATLAGIGNFLQLKWIGSGWAIAWTQGGHLYYARVDSSGAVAVPQTQLTFTGSNTTPYLQWNGSQLGLAWAKFNSFDPPGNDIYFTVLNTDGSKIFPEVLVVGNFYGDSQPVVYWNEDRFRLIYHDQLTGDHELEILPNGTIPVYDRFLGNHGHGGLAIAFDGTTLGMLWNHLFEMNFQTTECLSDASPPACPAPSLIDNSPISLDISWTAVNDPESSILSYNLYRDGNLLVETLPGTTSISDGGFTPGGPHVYELRALNGAYLESTGCEANSILYGCPAITLNPPSLPAGTLNVAYGNQTLVAAGGTAPYTYSVSAGALPSGMSLSPAGVLSGTPTATGTFNFTVLATDNNGCTGSRNYSIYIGATSPAMNLFATATSTSTIQLSWTDPQGSETGFRIERSLNGTTWTVIDLVGPNTTTYPDTGLTAATLYYYRVIAVSIGGDAASSNVAAATTFASLAAKICLEKISPAHTWARQISVAHNGTQWAAVWQERISATNDEIYFQLMNQADGTFTGLPVRITFTDTMSQYPTLRWNGANFGAIWYEHLRGPDGTPRSKPFFALLDASGNPVRGNVPIPMPETFTFVNFSLINSLVWDGSGWGIFFAGSANPPLDLYYFRLDPDGDVLTGPVQITNTTDFEFDVDAAWNGAGAEYGVTWVRQRDNNYNVYFQQMQTDGTLLGTPELVWDNPSNEGTLSPSIVWDGTGWAIAWWDFETDGTEVVYLRRLNATGTPLGAAVRISEDTNLVSGVFDERPLLLNHPSGGYIIYTHSFLEDQGVFEVARLQADSSGNRVNPRIILSSNDAKNSIYPQVAFDGTNFLVAYNDHPANTQELGDLIVNPAGAVIAGPNALTAGHTFGNPFSIVQTSGSPAVAAMQNGFVALWSEIAGGSTDIYGKIYDGMGGTTNLTPLSTRGGQPSVIAVGNTFAAAWKDAGTLVFNRYNSTGGSLIPETIVDASAGGQPLVGLDFNGEVYGVAWMEAGQLLFQKVASDGTLVGLPVNVAAGLSGPGPMLKWVGSGWAFVWRSSGNLFYARISSTGAVLIPPTQVTFSGAVLNQYHVMFNGSALGLAWAEFLDTNDPPGKDIYFTVLGTDGIKAFPAKKVVSTDLGDNNPSLYWTLDRFRLVYFGGYKDGLREIQILTNGDIVGTERLLTNHTTSAAVAWNGATLGVLVVASREMFFETTACLDDTTAPSCPAASLLINPNSLDVTWTAAADAESGILNYNVYRDGLLITQTFPATAGYSDGGFNPGGPHVYEVRAMNGALLESTGCVLLQYNCPAITVNPANLPNGVVGVAYNETITGSGGTAPYTFTVTAGVLPPGLTLSAGGVLSGTPTATGNFTFTVTARDANTCPGSREYTIVVGTTLCIPPDEPIFIEMVTLSNPDNFPILHFQDPNQPNQATGYNIYRTAIPCAGGWVLVADDVVDMDEGTPNKQWVDQSGDGGNFCYQVAAYNNVCPAEGPW